MSLIVKDDHSKEGFGFIHKCSDSSIRLLLISFILGVPK